MEIILYIYSGLVIYLATINVFKTFKISKLEDDYDNLKHENYRLYKKMYINKLITEEELKELK